jgi:hypothetical protein
MGTDPAAGPNKASKVFLQVTTQVKRAICCGFPVSPTLARLPRRGDGTLEHFRLESQTPSSALTS